MDVNLVGGIQDGLNISDDEVGGEDDHDEEEVHLTPAEVLEMMEEAWVNEKFAPEILPHKGEVVDCLLGQIVHMEANIKNTSNTDFKKSIHQLEVDRLRFLVSSYLRIRLEKIENFVMHILQQEEQRTQRGDESYLTEQELQFAKEYSQCAEQYFSDFTKFYPGQLALDQLIKPNIHSHVFVKSKKEVEGVILDDGNTEGDNDLIDLTEGSQMVISYNSVMNLVKNGDVHLI